MGLYAVDESKNGDARFGTLMQEGVETFALYIDGDLAKGIIILQCSLDIDQRRSSQCNVEAFTKFL